ncbi:dihydrolipoyl dehydrogenase [Clostridiaceae bacterium 35-E11]
MEKDIVIIGGGPAGYVAAIRAAQIGANVSLIEQRKLGGTCLNRGCIPTKALYTNAEILNNLKNIDAFGIKVSNYEIDVTQIQERKQKIVDQLVGGIEKILKAYGVEVINGKGTIKDPNKVFALLHDGTEKEITTKNIIIATGSKPSIPDVPGSNLKGVITSDELLNFREVPKKMAIAGSGVIGMEFAYIFNAMGSEVSVISSTLLKRVDKDLTKRLLPLLKKQGIKIYNDTRVSEIVQGENGLLVIANNKKGKGEVKLEVDYLLMASGRNPIVEGMNLDDLGVAYDKKGIKVDANFETNIKGVYAIGDAIGGMMLAHVASHEGVRAVEHIMGISSNANHEVVPDCIFIKPQIACVGLTEEEAKEKGLNYQVSKFMFGANGKALAMEEPDGFVKVIATEEDQRIVGVHIMGPHASDLIHEAALAITKKMHVEDIGHTIHAHPTLGEAFSEAVLGLKGEAIHMVPAGKRGRKE